MFGLGFREKRASEIAAGDYVLLGGIRLLYVREVGWAGNLLHLVTDAGKLLFTPSDILRVA